jgi:ATPase subunit of ABC transporter with duplicated ATPase domains
VPAIDVNDLGWSLPDGRTLLTDVSFEIGERDHVALVGANGAGKTTLLRILAGELDGYRGNVAIDGAAGYMPQFVGAGGEGTTLRQLFLSLEAPSLRQAASGVERAEALLADDDPEAAGHRYARALAAWEDVGGYDLDVRWDTCCQRAVGRSLDEIGERDLATFSGGEQKKLVLESLLSSDYDVLLVDEPDNYLDVPGKEWLAERLDDSGKTILFVSHDRELLSEASHKVVTLEARGAWTHGGSFATWHEARNARQARLVDEHKRWEAERKRLREFVRTMKQRAASNDKNAGRARAAATRLRHFEEAGPPPDLARDQRVAMRLGGGRTGKQVVVAQGLELVDLTFPFDLDVDYGDRMAVLGRNGTGKSHFLRLLAGDHVQHLGAWRLGARVVAGWFSQTHEQPELVGRTLLDALAGLGILRDEAMPLLHRYELTPSAEQTWETLSGGQQARFQIVLLEVAGTTLLLLDEPTDNLDVASAEALEEALATYDGTVIAVTHDRWFLRSFDRYLVFQEDGEVVETDEPANAWRAQPAGAQPAR